jgi:hypothetical protein
MSPEGRPRAPARGDWRERMVAYCVSLGDKYERAADCARPPVEPDPTLPPP